MMPPAKVALSSYFAPNLCPTHTPAAESTKVVQPISVMAAAIRTCRKANEMPTANASILVAIARMRSSLISSFYPPEALFGASSFFRTTSQIILPPIKVSKANAIQWSKLVI